VTWFSLAGWGSDLLGLLLMTEMIVDFLLVKRRFERPESALYYY
jgi:hypothetical protein